MTAILEQIRALVACGEVRVSLHGYEELAADNVPVRDIIEGLTNAAAIEEYPNYPKGACVLVLVIRRALARGRSRLIQHDRLAPGVHFCGSD